MFNNIDGIAWVWWSLAGAMASSRRGDPFTSEHVRRLRLLGPVLAGVWRRGVAMRHDLAGLV